MMPVRSRLSGTLGTPASARASERAAQGDEVIGFGAFDARRHHAVLHRIEAAQIAQEPAPLGVGAVDERIVGIVEQFRLPVGVRVADAINLVDDVVPEFRGRIGAETGTTCPRSRYPRSTDLRPRNRGDRLRGSTPSHQHSRDAHPACGRRWFSNPVMRPTTLSSRMYQTSAVKVLPSASLVTRSTHCTGSVPMEPSACSCQRG